MLVCNVFSLQPHSFCTKLYLSFKVTLKVTSSPVMSVWDDLSGESLVYLFICTLKLTYQLTSGFDSAPQSPVLDGSSLRSSIFCCFIYPMGLAWSVNSINGLDLLWQLRLGSLKQPQMTVTMHLSLGLMPLWLTYIRTSISIGSVFPFLKSAGSQVLWHGWTWKTPVLSQSPKDRYYRIPLMWGTWHSQVHRDRK